jgi:hypothetical protein
MSLQESFTPESQSDRATRTFYRYYSIDIGNRIALAEDREVDGDRAALALGRIILLASSHPKIEVWSGNMRVGVLTKDFVS